MSTWQKHSDSSKTAVRPLSRRHFSSGSAGDPYTDPLFESDHNRNGCVASMSILLSSSIMWWRKDRSLWTARVNECTSTYIRPPLVRSAKVDLHRPIAFSPVNLNVPTCKWAHICLNPAAQRDTLKSVFAPPNRWSRTDWRNWQQATLAVNRC